jgi:hypothetical protein
MAKKNRHKKKRRRDEEEDDRPRRKRDRDREDREGAPDDEEKGERIRRLLNELARELVGDVGPLVMGRIEKYLTAFHASKKKKRKK